jgi:hypothetical protein
MCRIVSGFRGSNQARCAVESAVLSGYTGARLEGCAEDSAHYSGRSAVV